MEEKDPIETKFKSAFADYEQEPPGKVWEHLHDEMHPGPGPGGFWARMLTFLHFPGIHFGFYLAFGTSAFAITFTVFYMLLNGHHEIRGHAYAGTSRIRHGTAVLFQVADHAMPWDSATHYRTSMIDEYGHFQFFKVGTGKYLLRVSPDETSETAEKYEPSYFEHHEKSDSCDLIVINKQDVNVEVHLVLSSKAPKQR